MQSSWMGRRTAGQPPLPGVARCCRQDTVSVGGATRGSHGGGREHPGWAVGRRSHAVRGVHGEGRGIGQSLVGMDSGCRGDHPRPARPGSDGCGPGRCRRGDSTGGSSDRGRGRRSAPSVWLRSGDSMRRSASRVPCSPEAGSGRRRTMRRPSWSSSCWRSRCWCMIAMLWLGSAPNSLATRISSSFGTVPLRLSAAISVPRRRCSADPEARARSYDQALEACPKIHLPPGIALTRLGIAELLLAKTPKNAPQPSSISTSPSPSFAR